MYEHPAKDLRGDDPGVKRDQKDYPLEQHGYADPNDIGHNQDDLERMEREGDETPAESPDKGDE